MRVVGVPSFDGPLVTGVSQASRLSTGSAVVSVLASQGLQQYAVWVSNLVAEAACWDEFVVALMSSDPPLLPRPSWGEAPVFAASCVDAATAECRDAQAELLLVVAERDDLVRQVGLLKAALVKVALQEP